MIDNYQDFKKYVNNLTTKPKLLLHSCCGPCSTHTLKVLEPHFDITVYYDNSNMDSLEEFNKRVETQKEVLKHFKDVKLIVPEYEPETYYEKVKGYEHLGEHSYRCFLCMELRMENSAKYAKEHGFDCFSTTLSISPYKNSKMINEIGYQLEEKYQIKYLYSNFKKENGYQDSIKLSHEYELYRQDYCGCKFSLKEREEAMKHAEDKLQD